MRGLTVKQPWAHMITHCGKDTENRTWKPPAGLGTFAIHAGARAGWDRTAEQSRVAWRAWWTWAEALPPMNVPGPLRRDSIFIDYGAIVAVCDLGSLTHDATGAEACSCSPWSAPRSWHWELANVRPLAEPVPCRGALGLWNLPADVESAVLAQLAAQPETEE